MVRPPFPLSRTPHRGLAATLILLGALGPSACNAQTERIPEADPRVARSTGGMVSSATPEATAAGLAVLERGGNAVDAAVAVGFALAVTYPQAGNLGGGGFMLIRMADGRTAAIDFRERAPAAATRAMFLDSAGNFVPDRSQIGALAVGVPGSPAGLLLALRKYGTRSAADVIAPAIGLAENGYRVHAGLATEFAEKAGLFARFPSTVRAFGGDSTSAARVPTAGVPLVQRDLAATLRRIAEKGPAGFYEGPTADRIVEQMRASGGIITHDDLRSYSPAERTPLVGTYRGDTVLSMPPPSSGGVLLIQMLNMMEPIDFRSIPRGSAQHAHLLAEIMRRAYADRAEHLGDPDFHGVPVSGLISKEYARARAATIGPRATPSAEVQHGDAAAYSHESPQTTHFSVIDRAGNCVSATVTLNSSFGSKLVVEGAGFFLNNEMDDFSAKPATPNLYGLVGNEANAIAPGKRMLSSMTPTIVVRAGAPWLVVGTPGGSTIITTVLQTIHNQIDYGMTLEQAVAAPRIHHQWRPDALNYERGALAPEALEALHGMGYITMERREASGRVDAIRIERDAAGKRVVIGCSDPRGYGSAQGER